MKKIVAYVGTNKTESVIEKYILRLIEILKQKMEIEFVLYTTENFPLLMCEGCSSCYMSHKCVLDEKDNMDIIKKDFMEADFIILGSPVYLHNVSGGMKNFLDRISFWSHIFALRGKNSMVITSATSNGTKIVSDYLEKILHFLGSPVVVKVDLLGFRKYEDEKMDVHTDRIMDALINPLLSNQMVEKNFHILKKVMKEIDKLERDDNIEIIYWKMQGMFEAATLAQIVEKETNKSN